MHKPIRLLIIDDSVYNRRSIAGFFDSHPDVEVVGKAANGQEGLQMVNELNPSVITVDLEMPKLDGFAFLRLLMASRPTPVIIISGHTNKDNVIRALELGAIDFVFKPDQLPSPNIRQIRHEVVKKVTAAAKYNPEALQNLSSKAPSTGMHFVSNLSQTDPPPPPGPAQNLVVIGASTGGPASLTRVIGALPETINGGILVVQHMPPRFTETFAKRLDKLCPVSVVELHHREIVQNGRVYIAPGDADLVVSRTRNGYKVKQMPPLEGALHTPSVNRLFCSAASVAGGNLLGVVLTGMGSDGTEGAQMIYESGGQVLVESEETAVVYGMPLSVLEAGVPARSKPLHLVARSIVQFCAANATPAPPR